MALHFPLLILVLIAYNVLVFLTGAQSGWRDIFADHGVRCGMELQSVRRTAPVCSDPACSLKSSKPPGPVPARCSTICLSTAVFVVALIEFILVAQAATTTFFLLVVITLLDVIAGFSVSITSARRDFSVGIPMAFG